MARSRPSACAPRCCSRTAIRWLWKTLATARRAWPSPRPARYRTGSTSTPRGCAATGSRALPAAAWPMSRRRTSTHRRHPVAGAAPGAAGVGRARRRLDRRGRLRRRVSLQRYAAGAAGRAGPTGPGALRRDLLQDRLPGVAPGLPGGPAGAGRALPPAAGHRGTPFGGGHPAGHGRLHRRGAFPAPRPPHAPRRPRPPRRLAAGWPEAPGCQPLPAVEAGLHLCVRVDSLARERP
ncbi:putative transcriptional regulator [Pseudomonas aeruginosa]|nr:putative transcriptional regulator [Pseudomonas aeruginosa]